MTVQDKGGLVAIESPISVSAQVVATVLAIVGAVIVPQIFHVGGAALGLGSSLAQSFLPMHLPIILVGFLAGPVAGCVGGLLGPVASFFLSGMPAIGRLPFMVAELGTYGLVAGLMRRVRLPLLARLVIVQVSGRVVSLLASAAVALISQTLSVAVLTSAWTSLVSGIPGLILQWAFIPAVLLWVRRKDGGIA